MKKTILTIAVLLCSTAIFADDYFEVNGICYRTTSSSEPYTVTVGVNGRDHDISDYTGDIVIPSSVEYNGKRYSVTSIDDRGRTGYGVFSLCTGLTSIRIPSSVTAIGGSAFLGCSSLTNISIPEGVTSIGNTAFKDCSSLTNINIPNSVTSIGQKAFSGCSSLITNISIPEGVTSIGFNTFYGCSSLTNITIPSSVTSIDNAAFSGCSSLTNISIPSSLTSIGQDMFSGCSSLTSISIPSSVTSISNSAFSGCSSLTNISIPSSLTSIGQEVFANCSSLTNISIPNSVTSISNSAFSGCSSLTNISIPSSVTSIGSYAFSGCTGLKLIRCEGSTPASCGASTFGSNGALATALLYTNCVLIVPEGSEKLYSKMEPWSNFDIVKSDAITNVETASEAILAVGTQVSEVAAAANTTEEKILNSTLHEIIELLQQLVETKKINLSEDGQNTLRALAALVENKTAIPTVENSFSVSVVGKTIVCSAESFQIYNLQGQNVTAQNGNLPAGVYMVVSKLGSQKVVIK